MEEKAQPNIGLASTADLFHEIIARMQVQAPGLLEYRTVDAVAAPSDSTLNNQLAAADPDPMISGGQKTVDHAPHHRAVRTKSTADRVYLLDEEKKTRQWATNPEVLKSLGFDLMDVVEVSDEEILKYQQLQAIYRVDS